MARDPVCGMDVNENGTTLISEHEGSKFYFCSAHCKEAFEKDPHRYGHGTDCVAGLIS